MPSSASLAIPPIHQKTEIATRSLDLLWTDGEDSLNHFAVLTIQKRIDDLWYASVMEECRYGALSQDSALVYLPSMRCHGTPTAR